MMNQPDRWGSEIEAKDFSGRYDGGAPPKKREFLGECRRFGSSGSSNGIVCFVKSLERLKTRPRWAVKIVP